MKDYNHENGIPYKMHCFIEMQFASHFYTVIPYQALFRLPVYKNSAVGILGAIFLSFCKIRDFGSPTMCKFRKISIELWPLIYVKIVSGLCLEHLLKNNLQNLHKTLYQKGVV